MIPFCVCSCAKCTDRRNRRQHSLGHIHSNVFPLQLYLDVPCHSSDTVLWPECNRPGCGVGVILYSHEPDCHWGWRLKLCQGIDLLPVAHAFSQENLLSRPSAFQGICLHKHLPFAHVSKGICLQGHLPSWASASEDICLRGHLPSRAYAFEGICLQGHLPFAHVSKGICLHGHLPSWASAFKGICLHGHLPSGASAFTGICLHLQGHLPSWASAFCACLQGQMPSWASAFRGICLQGHLPSGAFPLSRGICLPGGLESGSLY